ncbi:MAG: lytic transglycosylase domain-containing protein [Alphaproteobacteria bacterium]|nr:lytic transglycosylase domain-containing protein [Alphaproteobacteria bacterium]
MDLIAVTSSKARRIRLFCLTAFITFALLSAAEAGAQSAGDTTRVTNDLPRILSTRDTDRYRRIFALQEQGDFVNADRELARIEDRTLVGWALYQRYAGEGYSTPYGELSAWLAAYGDHPGANKIHSLALQRLPKGQKAPRPPQPVTLGLSDRHESPLPDVERDRTLDIKSSLKKIGGVVVDALRLGLPEVAEARLGNANVKAKLSSNEHDQLRRQIAAAYYFKGNDEAAYRLASTLAKSARKSVPLADWTAGLAAWRLGNFEAARQHFEALARSKTAASWNVAAGAYWAARTNLVTHHPEKVDALLEIAAQHPFAFYGLIAARLLGKNSPLDWTQVPLDTPAVSRLLDAAPVRRAIALREIGQIDYAERELRQLLPGVDSNHQIAIASIADRLNLASLQMRLSRGLHDHADRIESSHYPIPAYVPEDGFVLDRAMIFAFMREESGFNPNAKSPVGAQGLMQLMPRTASDMANDHSLRRSKKRLLDPDLNVGLGQKYLSYLLDQNEVQRNLFYLAAAYNAGPGRLRKWQREIKAPQDPLLFIESIPVAETRQYVQRVVSSFWLYSERLGQPAPSLDQVAAGAWPLYNGQDPTPPGGARSAAP